MNYNPEKPIAVFLGPSLEKSHASQLLEANYYPPARMGDVYRLLSSGVQLIVLIDGIFHNTASVWQRELLEALENNITVLGASSMGALRAAELYPFGMIGHGTIFEWYRDGVIDGDDEVALLHSSEAHGFRLLSEPLVNIRYTLLHAVEGACISQKQATDLVEYAKSLCFTDRSYDALFDSPIVKQWSPEIQDQLIQFIRQKRIDLKKQDAIAALKYAEIVARESNDRLTSLPVISSNEYYKAIGYRKRGFLDSRENLVSGEALLEKFSNNSEWAKTLRPVLIKNFFLLLWAREKKIRCPAEYLKNYKERWKKDHIHIDYDQWLCSNGLTEREFQLELDDRALLQWIFKQSPEHFGLEYQSFGKIVEIFRSLPPSHNTGEAIHMQESITPDQEDKWSIQAKEKCYLADWIKISGIACPPEEMEKLIKQWEESYQISHRTNWLEAVKITKKDYFSLLNKWLASNWIIEKGPLYFGYARWSFQVALLKELQMTGQAIQIIEK